MSSIDVTFAQNMVPNPSFETSNACPAGTAVGLLATHCPPWIRVPGNSPDYFHPCSTNTTTGMPNNVWGYQVPRTGSACVGVIASSTATPPSLEYIQVPLSSAMVAGQVYYAKMYVNKANISRIAIDRLGMHFSNNSLQQIAGYPNAQPAIPQIANAALNFITDTVNWTKIDGFYTAIGGEQWLSIGNFTGITSSTFVSNTATNFNISYYYIDDVCVTNLNAAPNNITQKDTVICEYPGMLSATTLGDKYVWNTGDTTPSISITTPGNYWVKTILDCSYIIDSFHVTLGMASTNKKVMDTFICSGQQLVLNLPTSAQNIVWSTGANTTTEIVNNAGTYWATYDDVLPCKKHIDTFRVIEAPDKSFSINDTVVCNELSLQLKLPGGYKEYTWQDGSKDSSFHVYADGNYSFTLLSPYNCVYTDNVHVSLIDTRQFFRDTVICNNQPISFLLTTQVSPTGTALWNDGSTHPNFLVKDYGRYTVTVSDRGCQSTTAVQVDKEWCDCTFLMPNAFSPNNDGVNDTYGAALPGDCAVRGYVLYIYNRWGQVVFSSFDAEKKWDGNYKGKPAEVGTYFYTLQLEAGTQAGVKHKKGELTLIR